MPIKNVFFKGVSRQPSDSISEDGQLAVAMNVARDNEVDCSIIEQPKTLFPLFEGERVLFIHNNNQYKHYIIYNGSCLSWVDAEDYDRKRNFIIEFSGDSPKVSVMGNTLILGCNDGIRYLLWNEDEKAYNSLGQKPPFVNVTFGLKNEMKCYPSTKELAVVKAVKYTDAVPLPWWGDLFNNSWVPPKDAALDVSGLSGMASVLVKQNPDFNEYSYDLDGKLGESATSADEVESTINTWTSGIMAYVNKFIADEANDKNKFCMPFFVRYCYEMYDNSMMMHSYPVLMTPSSKGVFFGLDGKKGLNLDLSDDGKTYEKVGVQFQGRVYGVVSELLMELHHTNLAELKKWKDLIKGVGIYITPPIYTHEQGGKVTGWINMDDANSWDGYYSEGNVVGQSEWKQHDIRSLFSAIKDTEKFYNPYDSKHPMPSYIMRLPYVKSNDYDKAMAEAAQFYRIGGIEFDELVKGDKSGAVIKEEDKNMLNTLTSGALMKDDYHTHDLMKANVFNVYNHRLNIGDVARAIHAPISPSVMFPKYITSTPKQWKVAVYTRTGGSKHIVVSELGRNDCIMPRWFFYPDANAYKAVLNDGDKSYEIDLTEHKLLEGAYWMASDGTAKVTNEPFPEPFEVVVNERGTLYTSPADNPFHFNADGINEIGDGKILAMAQAVQAMSEGQFGMHPMYCFTTQGVWALSVKEDGNWGVIHPVTRDVIADYTTPLSIDTSVIFISGRGTMMLSGRTSKVLDTVITGEWRDFHDKLADIVDAWDKPGVMYDLIADTQLSTRIGEGTKMMYDYKHQRVYFSMGEWSWVLNMLTWSWTQSATHITDELNSYPNCEFVQDDNVVSLDGDERYPMAVILTRHMKTGGEFLAKAHRADVVGNIPKSQADVVGMALYGSPDWRNNVLIASSTRPRITRIGGTGMKTHSLLVMMRDTDRKTLIERGEITIDATKTDKLR